MYKRLTRLVTMSLLFAALFVGIFSGSVFAHVKLARQHLAATYQTDITLCKPDAITPQAGTTTETSGNAPYCVPNVGGSPSFIHATANSGVSATWKMSSNTAISSCSNISVWIPSMQAYDTNVRYDFWSSELHWIGWVGFDINQANTNGYVQIGGLYNSSVTYPPNTTDVEVTARDDTSPNGANQQLAFAAMKFTCTFSD